MKRTAMKRTMVKAALAGSPGDRVLVKGWVKTRRDSKAGLSFINLDDGSCFGDLQVVAPAELPIGIVTAMIGGPFFLWILLKNRTMLEG